MVESLKDEFLFPRRSLFMNCIIVDTHPTFLSMRILPWRIFSIKKIEFHRDIIFMLKLLSFSWIDEYEPRKFHSRANFLSFKSHFTSFEHSLLLESFLNVTSDVLSDVPDFPFLATTIEWNSRLTRKTFLTSLLYWFPPTSTHSQLLWSILDAKTSTKNIFLLFLCWSFFPSRFKRLNSPAFFVLQNRLRLGFFQRFSEIYSLLSFLFVDRGFLCSRKQFSKESFFVCLFVRLFADRLESCSNTFHDDTG